MALRTNVRAAAAAGVLLGCSSAASDPGADAMPSPSATTASPAPSGDASACADGPVPTTADALNAWLHEGRYRCWAHESSRHPSTGPHGGAVQTYINATLDGSMTRPEHAKGSVAVKEFFGSGTEVSGWAVLVKTEETSNGGKGYYWYETFSTTPGKHGIEGQGASICTSCHAGGADYVLVPYPLR